MYLSLNILVDQLRDMQCELHLELPSTKSFSHSSLLPRDHSQMQEDFIYVCRLSEALHAAEARPGMTYLCLRDRIKDAAETEERLSGMIVVNENLDMESLFTLIQDTFFKISEWNRRMLEAVIYNKGIQDIIDLSEDVIGNTINVSDSAFTLLARTKNIPTDDPISMTLAECGYHPDSTLQLFRKNHRFEVWDDTPSLIINDEHTLGRYTLINKIFRFHNTYFTHVVMVCDHKLPTPGLLDLFQILVDILSVYMKRDWDMKNALSHNYDSFLTDLLDGTLVRKEEIEDRARHIGLPTTGQFNLIKIAVAPGTEASLGRLGRELSEMLPGAKVLIYQQAVIVLDHRQGGSVNDTARERMKEFLAQHHAYGGVSDPFTGLDHLAEAYQQAGLALKYSHQLRGRALLRGAAEDNELTVLFPYQDRIIHCLLGENPKGEQLWRPSMFGKALQTLYDYDRQHHTNNLELLYTYLHCDRKATETSQQLHMHRNNVLYRINRIEELMGLELGDYSTRLGLEVSFLCLEMYGLNSPE